MSGPFSGKRDVKDAEEIGSGQYFQPGTYVVSIVHGIYRPPRKDKKSEHFGVSTSVAKVISGFTAEDHRDKNGVIRFDKSNAEGGVISTLWDLNMQWEYIALRRSKNLGNAILNTHGFESFLDASEVAQLAATDDPLSWVLDKLVEGDAEKFVGLPLKVQAVATDKKVSTGDYRCDVSFYPLSADECETHLGVS